MPSKTKKQAKFMAAVANSPKFAKKAGVPQSVGRDFANADKGKTFKEGGMPNFFDSTKNKPGKGKMKYAGVGWPMIKGSYVTSMMRITASVTVQVVILMRNEDG